MTISPAGILAIALASSACTLAVAAAAWWLWGRAQVAGALLRIQGEFEQHVKRGVLAAGEELLPRFREQVALGFADVLKGSRAAGLAEGTAKVVAGGADLLKDGLGNLFGLKK